MERARNPRGIYVPGEDLTKMAQEHGQGNPKSMERVGEIWWNVGTLDFVEIEVAEFYGLWMLMDVDGRYSKSSWGLYKPTYNWGHHPVWRKLLFDSTKMDFERYQERLEMMLQPCGIDVDSVDKLKNVTLSLSVIECYCFGFDNEHRRLDYHNLNDKMDRQRIPVWNVYDFGMGHVVGQNHSMLLDSRIWMDMVLSWNRSTPSHHPC